MAKFKNLRRVSVAETPLAEEQADSLKQEALILLDGLQIDMFNGEEVTQEEIDDAK